MEISRWLGSLWLSLFACSGDAHAEPAAASAPVSAETVKACKGLPAGKQVARYEALGDDAVHVVAKSGDKFLAFPHQEGGGCEVYAVGKAPALIAGQFVGGDKAFALRAARCSGESCPVVIAVRKADKPIAAVRTDVDCDYSVELRPIQLFTGHDSIDVVCRSSAGAGWSERHLLVDVSASALTPLYLADTGSYIAVSPAEKKAGATPSCPVGSLRVEKVGDKPVIRVVDLKSGELHDGKGSLAARQLAFDPKRHDFLPTGAPDVPLSVDAHAGCRAH